MKRTAEQVEIHNGIKDTDDNMIINAVAGSGKTTVIVSGARYLPTGSIFVAFNKAIATELGALLPPNMTASTFNALGYKFLRERLSKSLRVKPYKSYDLIDKWCPQSDGDNKRKISRLVGVAKSAGLGIPGLYEDTLESWNALMDNYDMRPAVDDNITADKLIECARLVLQHNEDDYNKIDFDDQLYLTLKLIVERKWKPNQYPVMMVDETQDTSMVQAHLISHFAKRAIMVGDDKQAIYGFRGAGVDSMKDLAEFFRPASYDLSYTFRCASKIVQLAQSVNPKIKARPDAPEGVVTEDRDPYELWKYASVGDLVLCRNNYPLISVALDMLREKVPFSMSGDYPERLIAFAKSFKAQHMQQFRVRLKDWWEVKREELERENKMGLLQREEDKFLSLWELQKQSLDMGDLLNKLEYMTMNKAGPRLASIHSSKGLEATTVHFLFPELLPSKYATLDWQLKQEDNLYYVGVTRARTNLHFYEKRH